MSFDEVKAAVLALAPDEQDRIAALLEERWLAGMLADPDVRREVHAEIDAADREDDDGAPWHVVREELRGELDAIQRKRAAAREASDS